MKTIAIAATTNRGIHGKVLLNCKWFNEIYLQAYDTEDGARIAILNCDERCEAETCIIIPECKTKTEYVKRVQELTGSDEIKCYLYDNKKLRWRVTEPRWCSRSTMFYDRVSLSGERVYNYDLNCALDELIVSRYATLKDLEMLKDSLIQYHCHEYAYATMLLDWVDRVIYNMQHDGRKTVRYHYRLYWNAQEKCWCQLDNDRVRKSVLITDKSTGECHCYIPKCSSQATSAYSYLTELLENIDDPHLSITSDYYYSESVTIEVKPCGFSHMLPGHKYTCSSRDAIWLQQYIKLCNLDVTVSIK